MLHTKTLTAPRKSLAWHPLCVGSTTREQWSDRALHAWGCILLLQALGSHPASFMDQLFLLWITPLQENICTIFVVSLWCMRKSPTTVMGLFPVFLLNKMNQTWEVPSVWLERLTISKLSKEWKPQNVFTRFIIQKFCNDKRPGTILMKDTGRFLLANEKCVIECPVDKILQLKIYLKSILKMEFNLI